ncbi:MAG: AAA family ATPase [Candidatus Cloacimonetes bacterium]|nr:AAA family ATPase [Candidatus Cloacimonadota bacterium]
MKSINKMILNNFKRFTSLELDFENNLNILIGDNESGKSSIIQAIDIVLSGSRFKIESIGLENIFNFNIINNFLQSDKKYEKLPILSIELYLNTQNVPEMNGRNNSKHVDFDGLKLVCKPDDDFSSQIRDILQQPDSIFPFEFYSILFSTFADSYDYSRKKYIKHIVVDNSQMSNEYSMKAYVKDIYNATTNETEKLSNQNLYRSYKERFKDEVLSELSNRIDNYIFAIKTSSKSNLESDIMLMEDGINIENKGLGKQCFIKTKLALSRQQTNIDIVMLEEPENHLSHINMHKLVQMINQTNDKQIIIATHSDLISARLDLRKTILLNSNSIEPLLLKSISEDTAKFFMKAPDNNILQFVLSNKTILVEGDAEFILMEKMYHKVTNQDIAQADIHIISVGGKCFKRYLELAKVLKIKTAVITDNDGDIDKNINQKFSDYNSYPNIRVFYDTDNNRNTFEICLYDENKEIMENLFSTPRRTLSIQEYMLKNKTDCAFSILTNDIDINIPEYISDAIKWIKE